MIPIPSKAFRIAAAFVLLTSGAAFANCPVERIDHPNGKPTFAVKPRSKSPTVAIYINEQGLEVGSGSRENRAENRSTKINMGRGQVIVVRNSR